MCPASPMSFFTRPCQRRYQCLLIHHHLVPNSNAEASLTLRSLEADKMASPTITPHLLSIPREIRDQIYGYLHHDLELRTIERLGASQIFVSLTNVPYTNVFCAHPRLNVEYHESGPKDISAHVSNLDFRFCGWTWVNDAETVRRDNAALTHITKATIRFQPDRRTEDEDCKTLLNALIEKVPKLHTVRVAECTVLRSLPSEPDLKFLEPVLHDELPKLPTTLAELSLVQRANCWSVTTHLISEPPLPPHEEWYGIVQHRAHVYSDRQNASDLFQPAEVLHGRVPRSYIEWLRKLYKEKAVSTTKTTKTQKVEKVIGWKEDRCSGSRKELDSAVVDARPSKAETAG